MNAKDEFLKHTKNKVVMCAVVDYCNLTVKLPVNYNINDYERFLNAINFEYDCGYGGQELYGTIWYADGTWSERGEYDGSEWWEYKYMPEIPESLKGD